MNIAKSAIHAAGRAVSRVKQMTLFSGQRPTWFHDRTLRMAGKWSWPYLVSLSAELAAFEQRYLKIVGIRYARLDEIRAQIAEQAARKRTGDADAQEFARQARAQATQSHLTVEEREEKNRSSPGESQELKSLYREVAKRVHPDLSLDEDTQSRYAEHLAHFCHSGHAIGRTDESAWLEYLACQRTDESRGDALYHLGLECGGGLAQWPRDIRALPSQKLVKAYMWFRLSAEAYERAVETDAVSAAQRYSLNLALASSRWMCRRVMSKLEISEIAEAESLATERERGTQLGKRILVVDDEEPIREIVASILETRGFRCLLAESGNHALALLDSGENVDLITSCLLMADLDGLGLLLEVKRKYPSIPFAVLSAVHDLSVVEAVLRNGACDYLLKPFNVDQLIATVQRALRTTDRKLH